jgi:hypothetical protein
VSNGSGTVASANITSVAVSCALLKYTIGGTVTGLPAGGASIVLQDNGSDALTVNASGPFTFATPVVSGGTYRVTVNGGGVFNCTVSNGSGTVGTANVTNVAVSCQVSTYTIGGTVAGVSGTGGTLTLSNNDSDTLTVTADGSFTFGTPLASGSTYLVAASSSTLNCTVTNASGTVGTANVTNVGVSCQLKTYTIGGTVSGLSGSGGTLVLTDNGGNSLSLTADGPFTFTTPVATGSTYTVAAQPTNASCSVSNASGTVGSGNVNTVIVSCGPTFYIPFLATSVPGAVGQNGLFVIPSNNLAAQPTFVSTVPSTPLGESIQGTLSANGTPVSYTPYAAFYSAVGSDGNTHIYALNLTNTSSPPSAPKQLSSLGLPSSLQICLNSSNAPDVNGAQTNLQDGTTFFLLVHTAPLNTCGAGNDVYYVVRYTDSATTAPAAVAVNSTDFDPIYVPAGTLSGLVLLDSRTGSLNFYPVSAAAVPFTNAPTNLNLGFVTAKQRIYGTIPASIQSGTAVGNALFESVTNDSGTFLYRIDSTASASQIYRAQGTLNGGAGDANNVYFTDKFLNATTNTYNVLFVQAPLAGGNTTNLYTAASNDTFTLIGSNGTNLDFTDTFFGVCVAACNPAETLYTLPVGTTSATPTRITTNSALVPFQVGTSLSASVLLVGIESVTSGTASFTSGVFSPSGPVVVAPQTGSFWLTPGFRGIGIQIQGITATDRSYGGGSLRGYDAGSNAFAAPFTVAGGSGPYTIPAGDIVGGGFLSPTIGSCVIQSVTSQTTSAVCAFDVSANSFVTITPPPTTTYSLF